ncbi:peptidyl-prolyl cis-trans isomerase [Encephalitozoon intestinalis ATCC 50506]|uniref:Peptidyl-prolyl cis-trans isomerase n=1 Tax=Encephalitozoon intestinalis (strain ATCC 50506) TaxID=876142 RepID=E0S7F4_ENCIT|nr:peptidyl-prolyl cis-trans isomerase [Encephalitozoon intestinalis ATCC 50506]ADM11633.1 peptidyl-prolyl cis-trans isomerase [Encephalitozoon intestinalis ATCC 50506]UTX45365.1 peptidyl-prolyl cis-trans isomerase [Encephalitozoon intestinalis]
MWIKLKDKETGNPYFYNTETAEKTQRKPSEGFRLYHILIKHEKSRKPVDVSVEEAFLKIKEIYEELKAKVNDSDFKEIFKEYAYKHSQCSSSKRGGDLGFVCGNEMMKEFERPAFSLRRGEISAPVSTPSGFHIIYRR